MKKVLYVSHSADLNGAEICLLTLLRHLDRTRIEPVVVLPYEGILRQELERLRIRTYVLPLEWWIAWESTLNLRSESLDERIALLGRVIEEERPDIVQTNTAALLDGALAARMRAIPHVWHVHEILAGHPSLTPVLELPLAQRIIGGLADRVVAVSERLKESLARHMPGERITVIANGVEHRESGGSETAIRSELGIGEDSVLVATIGSLAAYKGVGDLLEAAVRAIRKESALRFVLAGSGTEDQRNTLLATISRLGLEGHVSYLGPRHDVPDLLSACDVVAVPSINESFSLVVVEAMYAGKAIVSTDCGGPAEILADGVTGLIVPVGNPQALSDGICRLAGDRELRRRLGSAARKQADRYNVRDYSAGFHRLYDDVLARGIVHRTDEEIELVDGLLAAYRRIDLDAHALAERDRTLAEARRDLQDHRDTLAARDRELQEFRASAAEDRRRLQERDELIATQDARLREREATLRAQEQHLRELYDSTSWKLTEPLRRLAGILRRRPRPKRADP